MKTFINFQYDEVQDLLEHRVGMYPEEGKFSPIKNKMRMRGDNIDTTPELSIIILTKDNLQLLRACLASIERFSGDVDAEIVIVSNCEQEETREYLDNSGYRVFYLYEPFSFARYNNYAVTHAKGRNYVFLNDDTVVTEGWLKAPLQILREDSGIGICGIKVLDPQTKLQHMGIAVNQPGDFFATHVFAGESPDIPQANEYRLVSAVSGVCMFVNAYAFTLVNGFSNEFDGGYFEDLDLCLRMERDTEKKVLYVPDSVIFHFESSTFNRDPNKMKIYHTALHKFRERWKEDIENTSYKFKSRKAVYGRKKERMIIRNAHLATAGGGEYLTLALAKAFRDTYDVEIQSATLTTDIIKRLKTFLKADLYGINFELLNPQKSCEVFINLEYGSFFGNQPTECGIYYVMFPHECGGNSNFLSAYDKVVGISNYTSQYAWDFWKRKADVIYPPVYPIVGVAPKEQIVLSVGRFFTGGHTKNQNMLLKAWKALDPQGWKLVLAGSVGTSAEELHYVEQLDQYIKLNGLNAELRLNIPREVLNSLYRRASIYWHGAGFGGKHPVAAEHFGISVVEAMSAGCIPVVYNAGGPKEIMSELPENTGWTDIAGLLQKTQEYMVRYEHKELDGLQNAIQERAAQFSYERFANQWQALVAAERGFMRRM